MPPKANDQQDGGAPEDAEATGGARDQVVAPPVDAQGKPRPKPPMKKGANGERADDSQVTPASPASSRPPTSPRPVSSSHVARPRPQDKASWQSDQYSSVAVIPNYVERSDQGASLVHAGLEDELTTKVLAAQPQYEALGYSEVVIQDMANAVVREIVGIFDSLIDRVLMGKKRDVIRTMVAELMTEDMSSAISTGCDQLKRQELGHIIDEHHKLYAHIKKLDSGWEVKLRDTQERIEQQKALWAEMDERFVRTDDRIETIEATLDPLRGVGSRMKTAEETVAGVHGKMENNIKNVGEMRKALHVFENFCEDTYATKVSLATAEERLDNEVSAVRDELASGLKELRKYAAADSKMDELEAEHRGRFKSLDDAMALRISRHKELEAKFLKAEEFCEETYATKVEHQKAHEVLTSDLRAVEGDLQSKHEEMEVGKASRLELSTAESALKETLSGTNQRLQDTSDNLEKTTTHLNELETHYELTLATKAAVEEVNQVLNGEIEQREGGKEKVAALSKALNGDREWVQQTISQQQHIRKDLNEAITDLYELKTKEEQVTKRCDNYDASLEGFNIRETEHWEEQKATCHKQREELKDLEVLQQVFREEFLSHVSFQKKEGEKLRNHSTQRYLEQMDKALHLHNSVESITRDHMQLNETVRGIKLPPVSD